MISFNQNPPCYIVFFFVQFKMEFGAALLHVWSHRHFSAHEIAMHLHACHLPYNRPSYKMQSLVLTL